MTPETSFWQGISQLIATSQIIIDRPRHSAHPRYQDVIYPLDYGYLENTTSGDGSGLDVWLSSHSSKTLTGILCAFDTIKRDMEIKLLIGCTIDDIQIIKNFHGGMCVLYILNPENQ